MIEDYRECCRCRCTRPASHHYPHLLRRSRRATIRRCKNLFFCCSGCWDKTRPLLQRIDKRFCCRLRVCRHRPLVRSRRSTASTDQYIRIVLLPRLSRRNRHIPDHSARCFWGPCRTDRHPGICPAGSGCAAASYSDPPSSISSSPWSSESEPVCLDCPPD